MTAPAVEACDLSRLAAWHTVQLRKRRGWSQGMLSYKSGVSRAMIGLIESGDRNFTLPVLAKVAAALEAEPWEMLAPRTGVGGG